MKIRLITILIVVGALLTFAGFSDTMMLLKGNTINLNTASQSEYSEKSLTEGDITFVYGPFATLETTTSNYGVKSKRETEFYLVSGSDELEYFVVFSTSDSEMISKLNAADAAWWDFLTDETGEVDYPDVSVPFKGKTFAQPTEDDYDDILDETLDELGLVSSDIAELRIVGTEVGASSIVLFVLGIVLLLAGIGVLVAGIAAKKKANSSDIVDDTVDEP